MLLASACTVPCRVRKLYSQRRGRRCSPAVTTILANTVPATPAEGLVHKAATPLSATAGDGAKSFIIMTEAALPEARKQVDALPAARQSAHRVKLARAACWLVQQVPSLVVPCWHRQALVDEGGRSVLTAHGCTPHSFYCSWEPPRRHGIRRACVLFVGLSVCWAHERRGTLGLAWRRTRNEDDGGVVVLAAGGAQPDRSRAIEGRLVPGRPFLGADAARRSPKLWHAFAWRARRVA